MQRKVFIKTCGSLCIGGFIAGSLLQSCTGPYYAIAGMDGNMLTIQKSDFLEILKDGQTKVRKVVLIRHEKLRFPVAVYPINIHENRYSALLLECTHNSCELNPGGEYLVCPCHGSEFDKMGKVQNPPAEKDLKTFKVTNTNEQIHIHLAS